MIRLLKRVTLRSVLETLFFGKPDAGRQERRNYLLWGHSAPSAEHKVIVLLALVLAALALGRSRWMPLPRGPHLPPATGREARARCRPRSTSSCARRWPDP